VTVALATVWLLVGLVGGTVTLRHPHDQYSPASPRHYSGVRRDQAEDWKDRDSAEDQPLDFWIGWRRSISAEGTSGFKASRRLAERNEACRDVPRTRTSSIRKRNCHFLGHTRESFARIFLSFSISYGQMRDREKRGRKRERDLMILRFCVHGSHFIIAVSIPAFRNYF